ncbi:MAG TPA: GAF domain-containing protein [Chryseolinea sp.]|nr:GAF domain-containing protein [Chryseolinea sp.]
MGPALWLNKTPFQKNRFFLFITVSIALTIAAVYQLSVLAEGWFVLHEKAPFVILLELLPILLILFLLFVTRNQFHEQTLADHNADKVQLIDGISTIIGKIKSGQYDKEKDITGEEVIDTALREIYEKFKSDADTERHRSWVNEGLAMLREVMGSHTEIKSMSQEVVSRLIKHVKANQGGVFILNDQNELDLLACYAFERKKFLKRSIKPGEGLVGQCYLERHSLYLTKVPQDYVSITSGLGQANPGCILIVPLNLKDSTIGVLEIASFSPFKKYELEFMDKVAEAFAQSISTIRVSEDTKKLLEKSLSREQEMKDQEERMKQNVEELYVTQEDMRKVNLEMEELFKAINALTATVELNRQGDITKLNDRFLQTLNFTAQDLYGKSFGSLMEKGSDGTELFSLLWEKVMDGKAEEQVFTFVDASKNLCWLRTGFYPLQGVNGIDRILVFLTNITAIKTKEIQADKANKEMEATRKMLIRILNEIPLKVFLKQYNGKFFVVNDTVSRFHGFDSPEGLIGKSDFDFYDQKDASDWLEAEHKIIASGRTEYIHQDGGQTLKTIKMPFYIDPLDETGILGLQADITELENLRKQKK